MDDFLECPVCMDRYALEGDKLPKLLLCGHTFCKSCTKSLVKRECSVTCPTCRHKHKCNNVENLPRNLTLLQLLEFKCSKTQAEPLRIKGYCSKCWENEPFLEKCSAASDDTQCKDCLKNKLLARVTQLQKLLAQGKESCEENLPILNKHLTRTIVDFNTSASLEYGRRVEMNELCDAFIEAVNANRNQGVSHRQQAISRFLSFYEMAERKLHEVRDNVRKDVLTCSADYTLTTLRNECTLHLNCLEETRDTMLKIQRVTDSTANRLSKRQQRLWRQCEKQVWERMQDEMLGSALISTFLVALLGIWIILGFLSDWACPVQESYGVVCIFFTALTGRYPIIIITFVLAIVNCSSNFHADPPPPYILYAIRQEVDTMISNVVRHLTLNSDF